MTLSFCQPQPPSRVGRRKGRPLVQRKVLRFEDVSRVSLASTPDLNRTDLTIRRVLKKHLRCPTLHHHRNRATETRLRRDLNLVAMRGERPLNNRQHDRLTGIANTVWHNTHSLSHCFQRE